MSSVFWIVVGATLLGGLWLVATGHLLPASAVLLSGAALGVVLGLLGRRPDSSVLDLSAGGLRRRGRATAGVGVVFLALGTAGWVAADEAVWRVLTFAGLSLTLGSVGLLWTARLSDEKDSESMS